MAAVNICAICERHKFMYREAGQCILRKPLEMTLSTGGKWLYQTGLDPKCVMLKKVK